MQHGTPQCVFETTASYHGRRLLRMSLEPLFRVARDVFPTISQYLYETTTFFISTTSSAPNAWEPVPAHISERNRIRSGSGFSCRGRIVS